MLELSGYCNGIVKGYNPEDWKSSVVLPIYKGKGEPTECGSYRRFKIVGSCYESGVKDPRAQNSAAYSYR